MEENKLLNSALECVGQNDMCSLRIICDLAQRQQCNLEEVDYYGNTALLKACYLGRYEAVKILLQFGANIRAINYLAQNALTIAAFKGHMCTIQKLLEYRSYDDFNASSIMPALNVAIMQKNRRLAKFFRNLDRKQTSENCEHLTTAHGLTPDDLERYVNSSAGQTRSKTMSIIF